MLKIQDWNLGLEQLKWDLWVRLDSLLDQDRISRPSREALLALNEEVIKLPLSSRLQKKLSIQLLE
jgi:hypothetical protein